MNSHRNTATLVNLRWIAGLLMMLVSVSVRAQSGPIATQTLFFNGASGAHEGNYLEAQTGLIYVDNATLAPGGSADELAMIGLVGDTSRTGAPRLDYHLNSDISLIKYLQNSYDTQPFGYLDGDAVLKVVPGLFSWVGRATYTQAQLDQSAPATPDNLEALTYLTTGPKFEFRPTLRTTIEFGGVYSYLVTSSKSPLYVDIDSQRYGGDIKVSRAFTNSVSAYLSYSYDKVLFQDSIENTDFDQKQYLLGFTLEDARTALDASGGYTQLRLFPDPSQPEVANKTPSGTTWQFSVSRLLSPTQRLSLHASKQITDSANLFRFNLDQPVPVTQNNQFLTDEPFTHRDYGVTWRAEGVRSTLQFSGLVATDRYEQTPASNRDSDVLNGLFTRKLNRPLIWELGVAYERDKYATASQPFTTTTLLTTLRWRLGSRLALRFVYAYSHFSQGGVSQNQIGVMAAYALTHSAQAPDTLMVPMTPNSPAMQPPLLQ